MDQAPERLVGPADSGPQLPAVPGLPPDAPDAAPREAPVVEPLPEVGAPIVPAGGDAQTPPGQQRRRNAGEYLVWTDVRCERCHEIAGQIRYYPSPLDGIPKWAMRCARADGIWPTTGPGYRIRRVHVVGVSDDFAREWVQVNRKCCDS